MESAVTEVSWNNLATFSAGDDLGGIGSFDFLEQCNQTPVDQPLDPRQNSDQGVAVVDKSAVDENLDLFQHTKVEQEQQVENLAVSAVDQQNHYQNLAVSEVAQQNHYQNLAVSEVAQQNHYQNLAISGFDQQNQYQNLASSGVDEQNQYQSWENMYPGWTYDHQTGQWVEKKHADIPENGSMQQSVVADDVFQQTALQQEVQNMATSAAGQQQIPSTGYESWENMYPGWTYNYQTGQWEEKKEPNVPPQNVVSYHNYQTSSWDVKQDSALLRVAESNVHTSIASYQFGQPVQYVVSPPRTQQEAMRSTAGRPPHAVTAFGFGGRLVIMKPKDPYMAVEQVATPQPFQVFQMSQLAGHDLGYGHCTGPLAGNASMKEVIKWVDERASKCLEEPSYGNPASLRYLLGLLKISCQHYGNLRSIINVPGMGKQDDSGPEAALAKLLEPGKREESWAFGSRCLESMPSEQQMQATAFEVKKLLIAGKQKEALRSAQEGQLWGCALLLARQLGEKFYSDTIAEMARRQFQPGFPLRTLTLLYAGQHAKVFVGNSSSSSVLTQGETASAVDVATQDAVEGMLEEWQENLAIMAANRTNGDETVIMYLGDCLWKLRNEVSGAHLCYLVANASFEPFSSSARLCLIGADHSKYPRTYASPEAIQRTEVYEFAKVTGNSQFILLPFQPYKLIYASMLAEAGKVNEALRYCQAVLKTLRTAGHGADVCKEVATSLEERLRVHCQGGSTSIVHRLFGNIGLPKMMGPSKARDSTDSSIRPSTAASRSSTSLVSASMEPISDSAGRSNMPVRSVSEPDFSRPAQIDSPGRASSKTPTKGVLSSFVQKAIGFIRTPSKEAKLGDNNKFRYDEKLKRWVEEGAEIPAEEPALAPPPTTKFSSRSEDNGFHTAAAAAASPERQHPVMNGIPPMPPSSNQYSARARQNVRSRYVDTFNKGSVTPPRPADPSLVIPAPARVSAMPPAPAKFFVPAAQDVSTESNAPGFTPAYGHQLGDSAPSTGPPMPDPAALANGNGPALFPVHDDRAASWGNLAPSQELQDRPGSVQQAAEITAITTTATSNIPGTFYPNHHPTAASVVSLPPSPAMEVAQPDSSQKEAGVPIIHTEAGPGAFGDDMQEVEL